VSHLSLGKAFWSGRYKDALYEVQQIQALNPNAPDSACNTLAFAYILHVMSAAVIFRVLADPTRLAVLENVMREEMTVSDLTSRFPVTQPAISQHLAVLRESELVVHRRDGRQIFYRADPNGLRPLFRWIDEYRGFWQERMPRLRALLREMGHD
jgi:DNA-binding transcriptional ArsR family regulator